MEPLDTKVDIQYVYIALAIRVRYLTLESGFLLNELESMLHELTSTTIQLVGATVKRSNLIGMSLKFLCNISTCICIRKKIISMENSLLFIFGKIWRSTVTLAKFCQSLGCV